ncbi:hypothetical protein ACLKA7_015450 [Drosophila subpalustris]
MQSQKALSDDYTESVEQLKAQIANLQASVLNLKNLLSIKHANENKATSCLDFDNWESVQIINIPGIGPFQVLCDACGGEFGWIVIQRRLDGSLGFYRDWNSYRSGFGYYDSEFFLGLEYIHRLTISRPYELYIELVDFENTLYKARYDNFVIGSEEEKYMLKSLGTYSGNAGDALRYNLYDKFSTYDCDNDKWWNGNCANYYESGWWFNSDANSNLNGNYFKSGYVIFSKFLLLILGAVSAQITTNDIDYDIIDKIEPCDAYCYNALKPLLDNAEKTNNKIEKCDNVIQTKDERIVELEAKLADLQFNVSIYKELETLYIEKSKYKDDLIAALEEKTCQDNNKEEIITSLKAQIEENSAAVKVLKAQVSSLNDSILLQSYNAKQTNPLKIQEFPSNCVPFENSTGIHEISAPEFGKFEVLCDGQTAGNGWTVVQRRFDGSENFYRNWSEYRNGFGSLQGEFFMGLEKLHQMTTSQPYELYIELVDFAGEGRHARYDSFRIGSEDEAYMLKSLGVYSGSAGSALNYNLHDKFTTFDRDNDNWSGNCAKYYSSGWWFNLYGNSNLNGKYFDCEVQSEESIWWYNWKGYRALKTVKMMIRPRYSSN